jgi:pimeloyl-ACP methyl ester carboxylesterase
MNQNAGLKRSIVGRILGLAALALAVAAGINGGAGMSLNRAQAQGEPKHQILFIFGLGTESASNGTEYDQRTSEIRAYLRDHVGLGESDFWGFSWRGEYAANDEHIPIYEKRDVCLGIREAESRLDFRLRRITWRNPEAKVTIVAHSAGGVLAAYWVAMNPRSDLLDKIHAIITLDSPLQGRPFSEWALIAAGVHGCGADQRILSELASDSRESVIPNIHNGAPWERANFVTIRNEPDLIVPSNTAWIQGTWRDIFLWGESGERRECRSWLDLHHSCVWHHEPVLRAIGDVVTTRLVDSRDRQRIQPSGRWNATTGLRSPRMNMGFVRDHALSSNTVGSSITYDFEGSQISMLYSELPLQGWSCNLGRPTAIRISIDPPGIEHQLVPECDPQKLWRWESPELLNGRHTLRLKIVRPGLFRRFYFDAFEIKPNKLGAAPPSVSLTATPECSGGSPQVRLNWTASSGATSYDVYRNGSLYYSGLTGTQFLNTLVTAGTTYTYYVKAKNAYGSTDSNTVTVTAPSCR